MIIVTRLNSQAGCHLLAWRNLTIPGGLDVILDFVFYRIFKIG